MAATHFSHTQAAAQQKHQHSSYRNYPSHPPSPPMEESKYSLPSISNLINLADAGSPTTEAPPSQLSPRSDGPAPSHRLHIELPSVKSDNRPGSAYARGLPPTPPMSVDASFESRKSPSAQSVSSSSGPSGYYESTPPREVEMRRSSYPAPRTQPSQFHAASSPYSAGPAPPGMYAQPVQPMPQVQGLFYQRALPAIFPPPMNVSVNGPSPWQHHHYLNPTQGPSYTQSPDRYICQTCNKAFSRPSSLRIHCHSHTGEKPFKCPHAGCGKAFSVRSNMKRHERGCHSFEVTSGLNH